MAGPVLLVQLAVTRSETPSRSLVTPASHRRSWSTALFGLDRREDPSCVLEQCGPVAVHDGLVLDVADDHLRDLRGGDEPTHHPDQRQHDVAEVVTRSVSGSRW